MMTLNMSSVSGILTTWAKTEDEDTVTTRQIIGNHWKTLKIIDNQLKTI